MSLFLFSTYFSMENRDIDIGACAHTQRDYSMLIR